MQHAVNQVCDAARSIFVDLGCEVEEVSPNFSDADEIFQVLQGVVIRTDTSEQTWSKHRELIKDTVVWNIEQGLKLSSCRCCAGRSKTRKAYPSPQANSWNNMSSWFCLCLK